MPTVTGEVDIDFDISDYEDDFKDYYCNDVYCLNKECGNSLKIALEEYVKEMYKNLYICSENSRKIKTIEEIYDDLYNMIRE